MATSQGQSSVNPAGIPFRNLNSWMSYVNNTLHAYFKISEINNEGFEVQTLGITFIFVKNGNDLIIFKEEERKSMEG